MQKMPHMGAHDSARAYARAVRSWSLPVALGIAALASVGWACLDPGTEPATATITPQMKWSEPARDALVPACGSCHRSDLPTAKPGALAIFDLSKDVWWEGLSADHDAGFLMRVRGTKSIEEQDRLAVEAFLEELRHGAPVESSRLSP
jgi:hypothetical protein